MWTDTILAVHRGHVGGHLAAVILLIEGKEKVLHENASAEILAKVHVVLQNTLHYLTVVLEKHLGARIGATVLGVCGKRKVTVR